MFFTIASLTVAAAVATAAPAAEPTTESTENAVKAELVMAGAVASRQAQPLPEKLEPGQTIYAFTTITGPGGGFVEHVWTCNGKEVSRQYLPVGQSKRWRTWSRHKLTVGQYNVQVLSPKGTVLQETSFEVLAAAEN
jgi:hypothetical protein